MDPADFETFKDDLFKNLKDKYGQKPLTREQWKQLGEAMDKLFPGDGVSGRVKPVDRPDVGGKPCQYCGSRREVSDYSLTDGRVITACLECSKNLPLAD